MKLRGILVFLFLNLLYSALSWYIGWNGWVWLRTAFGLQEPWIFGLLVGVLAYAYLIGRFLRKLSIFKILGALWFAILQYALMLLPIADLVVLLLGAAGFEMETVIIWTGLAVVVALAVLIGYGLYNAYSPVVRTYSIVIPKGAGSRSGLRIAMASDMHFGHLSGVPHLKRLVKGIKELKPDLILLPGDIIDDDPEPFVRKKMGDLMQELKAPLGVYGVLGNHEYYGGAVPQFLKEMERVGIRIMLDEVLELEDSFYLVGRKDKTDRNRQSIEALLKELSKEQPIIMMDHQPAEIRQAETHGVDLLLSGHTHRGQMAPNHLITRRIFDLDWGHKQFSQLHAIVSSGFGFWGPPIRIGSRSEIVDIHISFSNESRSNVQP